jgi:hypothetical protein
VSARHAATPGAYIVVETLMLDPFPTAVPDPEHRPNGTDETLSTRSDTPEPLVYTPAQAARMVATTEAWLRRKAGQGRIPCTRIGKRLGFTRDDLTAIVDAGRQPCGRRAAAPSRPPRRRR